jgi:signal transduction histidine kinase
MNKTFRASFSAFVGLLIFVLPALAIPASDNPQAKIAVDLIAQAQALIKEQGLEKTVPLINDPKGSFVQGDIYVFVFNLSNVCQAHGANSKMAGKDMSDLKDPNGVYIIRSFTQTVKDSTRGWVDYSWTNPVTKKLGSKSSYVERIPGTDYYVGAGIYNP